MAFELDHIADTFGMLNHHIGVWENFGYHNPPAPDAVKVRPLGERDAEAIKGGHAAVKDVDGLIAGLHAIRDQLVRELRENEDIQFPELSYGRRAGTAGDQ